MITFNKETSILNAANILFMKQGYIATTMRQVSENANVSLGLIGYYYKSKRQLAVKILNIYLNYLKYEVAKYINPVENPLVHSATFVRLSIELFMSHPCKQFYMECLEQDIYMESIQSLGNNAIQSIAQKYNSKLSNDILLLYDNYIPPSVEKILILEKKNGLFKSIDYDEIPSIVFATSVERFIDKNEIDDASKRGMVIAREILKNIPKDITTDIIQYYLMQIQGAISK